MVLRVVDESSRPPVIRNLWIREGETYLHPGGIPHNPIRFENTLGVVIEKYRRIEEEDMLKWFCEGCHNLLHEEIFKCLDIEGQLSELILAFTNNKYLRTCKECGLLNQPIVDIDKILSSS